MIHSQMIHSQTILASGAGIGPLLIYAPVAIFSAMVCFVAAHEEKKRETPKKEKIRRLRWIGLGCVFIALISIFYLFPKELGAF